MAGSDVRWIHPDELDRGNLELMLPGRDLWIARRAVETVRLLRAAPPLRLQREL